MNPSNLTNGLQAAIDAAGSQRKLAILLGVSHQYINRAHKKGYVSPDRAVEIEAQFGIPRHTLVNPKLVRLLDLKACA
jgi:DNA-binding transcriptional regulator YdaS (Cro superfamily)